MIPPRVTKDRHAANIGSLDADPALWPQRSSISAASIGTPGDLHERPASAAVGSIFGGAQIVSARQKGANADGELATSLGTWPVSCIAGALPDCDRLDLLVHAETLDCTPDPGGLSVVDVHPLGVASRVLVMAADGQEVTIQTTSPVETGARYRITPQPRSVRAFAAG